MVAHRLVLEPLGAFFSLTTRSVVGDVFLKKSACRREAAAGEMKPGFAPGRCRRIPNDESRSINYFISFTAVPAACGTGCGAAGLHWQADLAGGCALAGSTGFDIENTVSYQCFILLTAMLMLSAASCVLYRARFAANRILPRVGTAGQPLHYRVQIKNLTAKPQAGLVFLENLTDPRPPFAEWLAFQVAENRRVRPFRMAQRRRRNPFRIASSIVAEIPPLAANRKIETGVELLPLRQGILRLEGIMVARADRQDYSVLFRIRSPQTVLILPKRYPLLPSPCRERCVIRRAGVALAANIGRSRFVALRGRIVANHSGISIGGAGPRPANPS